MPSPLALHEEQQFHFLLFTAVERFTERLEQRCGGSAAALDRLRDEPEGEGIWLTQFAQAIFNDFLLNNPAGACFILQALASQPSPVLPLADITATIETHLQTLALAAFARSLQAKTEESLERNAIFEPDAVKAGA